MPGRNETYSYQGPGSQQIEKGKFPKLYFEEDTALLSKEEEAKLDEVTRFMEKNASAGLLIVGFAQDNGTSEYNRVLGEQRAQTVRLRLIKSGCSESALQTLSFGAEESQKSGREARRVELGIVR